jgi:glycosyltransferase involved in cell wall biosynthesis
MTSADHSPRVTIGVPVYNGARFLAQTLDSLLAQSYRDFELCISDNASIDDTPAICEKYAALDSRIRYSRNARNLGSAGNLRRVVEMSHSAYFKLANADDVCAPELLSRCVAVLEREPDVVLCFGQASLIDANGKMLGSYKDHLHLPSSDVAARFWPLASRIRMTNALQGITRTSVVKPLAVRYGSYDGADLVLLVGLALRGTFHEIQETLFFRRMHEMSATAKTGHEEKQQYLDPSAVGSLPAYLLKIHAAYLREIALAPISSWDKARLSAIVARLLASQRADIARELLESTRTLVRRLRQA